MLSGHLVKRDFSHALQRRLTTHRASLRAGAIHPYIASSTKMTGGIHSSSRQLSGHQNAPLSTCTRIQPSARLVRLKHFSTYFQNSQRPSFRVATPMSPISISVLSSSKKTASFSTTKASHRFLIRNSTQNGLKSIHKRFSFARAFNERSLFPNLALPQNHHYYPLSPSTQQSRTFVTLSKKDVPALTFEEQCQLFRDLGEKQFRVPPEDPQRWLFTPTHTSRFKNSILGEIIKVHYDDDLYKALTTFFPTTNFCVGRFGAHKENFLEDYHQDPTRHWTRLYKALGLSDHTEWYNLPWPGTDLATFLKRAFPQQRFISSMFLRQPAQFWQEAENRQAYFLNLSVLFNIQTLDDWYSITNQDVTEHGGALIMRFHRSSLAHALKELFPDQPIKMWKFSKVPGNFWQEPDNICDFVDSLTQELGLQDFDEFAAQVNVSLLKKAGTSFVNVSQDIDNVLNTYRKTKSSPSYQGLAALAHDHPARSPSTTLNVATPSASASEQLHGAISSLFLEAPKKKKEKQKKEPKTPQKSTNSEKLATRDQPSRRHPSVDVNPASFEVSQGTTTEQKKRIIFVEK